MCDRYRADVAIAVELVSFVPREARNAGLVAYYVFKTAIRRGKAQKPLRNGVKPEERQ
jgi:hypothetical protein